MQFPAPTERQGRIFWAAITMLAVSVAFTFVTAILIGAAWLVERLATIFFPLAVAAIISYLLDPVVDFFEKRDFARIQAIFIVYFMAFLSFLAIAVPVVPKLIVQVSEVTSMFSGQNPLSQTDLDEVDTAREPSLETPQPVPQPDVRREVDTQPDSPADPIEESLDFLSVDDPMESLEKMPESLEVQVDNLIIKIGDWMNKFLPVEVRGIWKDHEAQLSAQMINFGRAFALWFFRLILSMMQGIGAWTGYLIGFAMVPVFVFFFLLEKWRIVRTWTDYLPVSDPEWKKEVIFVLTSINDSLIVFFRGQVLVAICIGFMLAIGFSLVGLKYGVLLGVAAGVLSIIPYLGFVLSILPAVFIAIVQYGDLWHPLLTVLVFLIVQFAEGMFISPKIIGDRVGLHPLTIILAVLIGTTLMGGLLGAVLAIPLTAAGRAILIRYVWKRDPSQDLTTAVEDGFQEDIHSTPPNHGN